MTLAQLKAEAQKQSQSNRVYYELVSLMKSGEKK